MSKKTNEKKNSFKKDIKQLKTIIMPLNAKQTGRYDKKVAANQIYIPAGVLMIIAGVILLVKSIFSDKNESEFSNILVIGWFSCFLLLSIYLLLKKFYDYLLQKNSILRFLIRLFDIIVSVVLAVVFGICFCICYAFFCFRDRNRLAIDNDNVLIYSSVFGLTIISGPIIGLVSYKLLMRVINMTNLNVNEQVVLVLLIVIAIVILTRVFLYFWEKKDKEKNGSKEVEEGEKVEKAEKVEEAEKVEKAETVEEAEKVEKAEKAEEAEEASKNEEGKDNKIGKITNKRAIQADLDSFWLFIFTLIIIISNIFVIDDKNKELMKAINCVYVIYVAWDLLVSKHRESHFDVVEKKEVKESIQKNSDRIGKIEGEKEKIEKDLYKEKKKTCDKLNDIEKEIKELKKNIRRISKIEKTK